MGRTVRAAPRKFTPVDKTPQGKKLKGLKIWQKKSKN